MEPHLLSNVCVFIHRGCLFGRSNINQSKVIQLFLVGFQGQTQKGPTVQRLRPKKLVGPIDVWALCSSPQEAMTGCSLQIFYHLGFQQRQAGLVGGWFHNTTSFGEPLLNGINLNPFSRHCRSGAENHYHHSLFLTSLFCMFRSKMVSFRIASTLFRYWFSVICVLLKLPSNWCRDFHFRICLADFHIIDSVSFAPNAENAVLIENFQ